MRDEKDPGTMEMPLARKRGRPPRMGVAMTAADRAFAYRQRRKIAADWWATSAELHALSDAALVDSLREAVSKGRNASLHSCLRELARRYPEKE